MNKNVKGKCWGVLLTLASLAMGFPNHVAAADSEQENPRVTAEIIDVQYLDNGQPHTLIQVCTHNFPKNAVVTVAMGNLINPGFPMQVVLDDAGRPCTGPSNSLQPALFSSFASVPGEPITFVVRDQKGNRMADTFLVPVPLVAKDANGRKVEAILMSPTGSEYLVCFRGFKPYEKVTYTSKQHGEVVTGSVTICEDGMGSLIFGLEVLGKKKGVAKVEFKGEQVKLALDLVWGQSPRDLLPCRRAKC